MSERGGNKPENSARFWRRLPFQIGVLIVVGLVLVSPDVHAWQEETFPSLHLSDSALREIGWGTIAAAVIGFLFTSYNRQQDAAHNEEARRYEAERDAEQEQLQLRLQERLLEYEERRDAAAKLRASLRSLVDATEVVSVRWSACESAMNEMRKWHGAARPQDRGNLTNIMRQPGQDLLASIAVVVDRAELTDKSTGLATAASELRLAGHEVLTGGWDLSDILNIEGLDSATHAEARFDAQVVAAHQFAATFLEWQQKLRDMYNAT